MWAPEPEAVTQPARPELCPAGHLSLRHRGCRRAQVGGDGHRGDPGLWCCVLWAGECGLTRQCSVQRGRSGAVQLCWLVRQQPQGPWPLRVGVQQSPRCTDNLWGKIYLHCEKMCFRWWLQTAGGTGSGAHGLLAAQPTEARTRSREWVVGRVDLTEAPGFGGALGTGIPKGARWSHTAWFTPV